MAHLAACPASGRPIAGQEPGDWTPCPVCDKPITVTRALRLRVHGTRVNR